MLMDNWDYYIVYGFSKKYYLFLLHHTDKYNFSYTIWCLLMKSDIRFVIGLRSKLALKCQKMTKKRKRVAYVCSFISFVLS